MLVINYKNKNYKVCCNEFEFMFHIDTGYEMLATMTDKGITLGGISDTINFCPYCGQKIELV